jgi:hypothetical protein
MSEVLAGECVAVYARVVAQSAKRVHYLTFMVNETRGRLAAIFECMNAFIDLTVRRTAAFPPEIASRIAAAVEGAEKDRSPQRVSAPRRRGLVAQRAVEPAHQRHEHLEIAAQTIDQA